MENIKELIDDYIDSIRDDINLIEALVLEWDSGTIDDNSVKKVMRIIHSLKGSSSSYGFRNVSRLCHKFEDKLIELKEDNEIHKGVDSFLKDIDEFKEFIQNAEDIEAAEDVIKSINKTVLIVDESSVFPKLIIHELKALGIRYKVLKDGINALEDILAKKFDAIVLSTSIKGIDGISLLKTIKVIDSVNQDTPVALLSSREKLNIEQRFRPNIHIVKSENVRSTLNVKIKYLLEGSETYKNFEFKKVAYIDDSKSLHPLMKIAFKNYSCSLNCFETAKDGIEFIKKEKPDLILCDYNLDDDQTGVDVLRSIPGHEAVFFFLTAEDEDSRHDLAESNDMVQGVISKPFSPKHLVSHIVSALND